jgi:MFS family permease
MRLWQFVAVRSLIGLGESVYFPAAASLLSDYHGPRTRSTALSIHQSAVYLGTIAGGGLGAWIAQAYGWRWTFYGFGAVGIAVSVFLVLRLREASRGASEHEIPQEIARPESFVTVVRELLDTPGVLFLMGAFACANGVGAIFMVWAPTFLLEKFHMGLVAAGFSAVAAIQLASAASAPLSGILADRMSRTIPGSRMLVQAVALLLGSGCVVAVGMAPTIPSLMAAMLCFGIFKGAYDGGIFASVFDLVEPSRRSSVAGLMNTLGWAGGALGPLMVGIFSTYGSGTPMERMSSAIVWSALAYLAAAGLILTALKRRAPKR